MIPLKSPIPGTDTPFELLLLAMQVVVLALAIAIIVIAFQGYRRNDSRPMLFIALGFGVIFLTGTLAMAASFVVEMTFEHHQFVGLSANLVGLSLILYAIRWAE